MKFFEIIRQGFEMDTYVFIDLNGLKKHFM